MSANNLDRQPEERLITEIKDLKRQLSELRTLQSQGTQAINLQSSAPELRSMSLTNDAAGYFWFDLVNADNRQIFSMFEYSLFQGTATMEHQIGSWLNNYADLWEIWHHTDYAQSNGNPVRECIWVRNKTGSTQTIHAIGSWRFLVSNATASSSTT